MGTIQILKNRAGRYYVRVKHDNGRILCHCQAVKTKEEAEGLAGVLQSRTHAEHLMNTDIFPAKNGEPFFISAVQIGELLRIFFSETYSSRAKAKQGKDAFIRICKEGRIEDLTNE